MVDLRSIDDLKLGSNQAHNLYKGTKRLWSGYHKAVLEDGPVGYWRLEETSGTTVVSEVTGNTEDVIGGAELGVSGRLGSGALFNGVDSRITLPVFGIFDGSAEFSFECWVYPRRFPPTNGSTDAPVALAFRSENNVFLTMADGNSVPNSLGVRTNQDGGWGARGDTGPLASFRWYHIVATYSPIAGYVLYLDGTQVDSSPTTGAITATTLGSFIGAIPTSAGRFLYGLMDEVAVYDYVLAASQADFHYRLAGKHDQADVYSETILRHSPVAFYRLEESSGTTAACEVSSSNNGSHVGSPTYAVDGVAESHGIGLDGENDYVSLPTGVGAAQLPVFSLEFWAWPNPDTSNSAWSEGIPANWSNDLFIFYLGESNNDNAIRIWWDGSTRITIDDHELVTDGWHHFVLTRSADRAFQDILTLYFDGEEVGTSAIPSGTWTSTSVRIGAGNNNGSLTHQYNGLIDEVAVYDYVLSLSEIREHFYAG